MSSLARAPRRRTWRQDPAGRRARILAEAARAFAEHSYRATRVSEIARRAGVSEGTVYAYFPSKQALLVAVGERYGRGLAEAAFAGATGELRRGDVERIVRNIFRYVRETEGSLAAFLLTSNPEEGGPAQSANRAQMLEAIETALRRAIAAGLVPTMDPRVAAELQFGLVETALRDCFLRRTGSDEELYVREVTRALSAMLGEPNAERAPRDPAPPASVTPR